MVYPIGKLFRPIFTFPVKHVGGIENLPKDKPFIIASNHNSFIDPIILASVITKHLKKKKMYFISAMFLFFDLLVHALISEFAGSIRLRKKVHGSFLKSALKRLKEGNIIGIFPEGIPNKQPSMRKGKTGVARLVLKGKVPVVPIGIDGTLYLWSRLKWFPRANKKVKMKIGKPLYFKKYYGKDNDYPSLEDITRIIMKNIASLMGKTYNF